MGCAYSKTDTNLKRQSNNKLTDSYPANIQQKTISPCTQSGPCSISETSNPSSLNNKYQPQEQQQHQHRYQPGGEVQDHQIKLFVGDAIGTGGFGIVNEFIIQHQVTLLPTNNKPVEINQFQYSYALKSLTKQDILLRPTGLTNLFTELNILQILSSNECATIVNNNNSLNNNNYESILSNNKYHNSVTPTNTNDQYDSHIEKECIHITQPELHGLDVDNCYGNTEADGTISNSHTGSYNQHMNTIAPHAVHVDTSIPHASTGKQFICQLHSAFQDHKHVYMVLDLAIRGGTNLQHICNHPCIIYYEYVYLYRS